MVEQDSAKLISRVVYKRPLCSAFLTNFGNSSFVHLKCSKWNFVMVLICIFLIINEVEYRSDSEYLTIRHT